LWNGIETPVTGLLYGGTGQFIAQVFEVVFVGGTVFVASFIFFKILNAVKFLRVSREVELEGLDLPEMGSLGYPKDFEPEAGAEVYSRKKSRVSTSATATAGK
jgi:Amt family ammonium transporter